MKSVKFPSLHIERISPTKFEFVIATFFDADWHESLRSPAQYDTWIDAHIEGVEAIANLVMIRAYEDREEGVKSELPIYRVLGRSDPHH